MYGNVATVSHISVAKKLCNIMCTIVDEVASYCNDSGIGEIDFNIIAMCLGNIATCKKVTNFGLYEA